MNHKVSILIEGKEVVGEVTHRSASDITVRITEPYNLSTGLHIPYFARPYRSYDSEYGDETIKGLIKKLYDLASFIDRNYEDLRKKYESARAQIGALGDIRFDEQDYQQARRDLKKKLKRVEIDNKEHQKQLTLLRKKRDSYQSQIRKIIDEFFESNFPQIVPYGTKEEVLSILER